MANNEILQIVVFSMFFGIGGASLGEKFNAPLVAALDVVSHIMLKVTGYVMYVAPLAIFAAISSVISTQGLGSCLTMRPFTAVLCGDFADWPGSAGCGLCHAEKRGISAW